MPHITCAHAFWCLQECWGKLSEAGTLCYGTRHIAGAAATEAGNCSRNCGAGQGYRPHPASDPVQRSDDSHLEPAAEECSAPRVSGTMPSLLAFLCYMCFVVGGLCSHATPHTRLTHLQSQVDDIACKCEWHLQMHAVANSAAALKHRH